MTDPAATASTAGGRVPDGATLPECDVIMKGGITSGVIYPRALVRFARTYRLRRLGGASAGAIGAALGAAAEHGRGSGGFERLGDLPQELGDGALAALFQPEPATRPLLGVLLTATGHDAVGAGSTGGARVLKLLLALLRGWPGPASLGALPGFLVVAWAATLGGWSAAVGALAGLALALVGVAVGVAVGVWRTLTRDVPANLFGICTGLGRPGGGPGFTDWLSQRINTVAGRPADDPLRYGHLWTGTSGSVAALPAEERVVDLRMVSTCLSQGRPYEMPWESRGFFYEPAVWRLLFPAEVMAALEGAPPAPPPEGSSEEAWAWEESAALAAPGRSLRRLPAPEHLPVVVSVRLSLSFPLLISAVPLWITDWRSERTRAARAGEGGQPDFLQVWFTDGGFCNNFPVHLFDDALPVRPTFAVNLGTFLPGRTPSPEQAGNVEFATSNAPLLPSHRPLPASGIGALAGFFSAALATSREWQDASQLATPGLRDRVVRVLQSRDEGGLNLFMDTATITGLADRGDAAAAGLVDMFTGPHYGQASGWDNHRWVRYRALLAALPGWLADYAAGRAVLDVDPAGPPSYALTVAGRQLAADLDALLLQAAAAASDPERAPARTNLTRAPRPVTHLRRVPQL